MTPAAGLYPALTGGRPCKIKLNFGSAPWQHAPPDDSFVCVGKRAPTKRHEYYRLLLCRLREMINKEDTFQPAETQGTQPETEPDALAKYRSQLVDMYATSSLTRCSISAGIPSTGYPARI